MKTWGYKQEMHFDLGFKHTHLTKWDKDKRPVLEVLTIWKEKKTLNINWNIRILASLMFKITKRTKKENKK